MDIISNQGAFSNNHVLNTLCMKYADQMFGNSEFSLRLPNLLMLLVYFTYTFLLLRKTHPVVCISIFVLMVTNTTLIDFFGLARGYGMSVGFMMMSLYHLIASFKGNRNKHLVLFNIGALLAILSNFTMLTFYLPALIIFNIVAIMECRGNSTEKFNFFRVNKVNLILFLVLLIILYEPVRKAVKFNSFDFGGKIGFVTDTVTSLIYNMFMNVNLNSMEITILQICMISVVILSLVIILIHVFKAGTTFFAQSRELVIVNLIILSVSMESILQHYILRSDYMVGRFSLFLLPLFVLNLGFLIDYILKFRIWFRFLFIPLAVSLAILSASNFYLNRNLYSCAEWGYDMETKNAVTALINYQKNTNSPRKDIKLGINWLFEPTINFYRETRHLDWLLPVDRNGFSESDDFVYLFEADADAMKALNHEVIFSSAKTNTILMRNKK
jgi:hypothetical protein